MSISVNPFNDEILDIDFHDSIDVSQYVKPSNEKLFLNELKIKKSQPSKPSSDEDDNLTLYLNY